ncbi:MAG: enoyl-CoA hydratase [Pseudomonadales bacterium]|nr:enoyl-CoA hydratase [Pseudomonadales bacterium]
MSDSIQPGEAEGTPPPVRYSKPHPRIARIVLNRPERANAQNYQLLYDLNDAFDRACADDEVRVIVLAAAGKHFSSGHDLSGDRTFSLQDAAVGPGGGFDLPGMEGYWAREEEVYFGLCWRWRNLPKITIAEVQGKVIAGGLMLVWPCDLVVASEDATFQDPVVAFGANGVEYFGHPWEFGPRKAKELLFTGRALTARAARELGMVNRVVARELLTAETMALAEEIAQQPMMGLKTAKESVNQAQDAQGFYSALRSAMSLQELAHAQNFIVHKSPVHPDGMGIVRELAKKSPLNE